MSRHNPAGDWVVPPVNSYVVRMNSGRFEALAKRVAATSGEKAQVNAVVHTLAGMGYKHPDKPDVYNATVDRSTYRVYVWRSTPFGDHVVLGTGPAFEAKLALGSQVPAEPGVGVFVQAALAEKIPPTLAGASRAASRGAHAAERTSAGESRAAARSAKAAEQAAAKHAAAEAARAAREAARAAEEAQRAAEAKAARKPRAPKAPKAPAVPEWYSTARAPMQAPRRTMRHAESTSFRSLAEERAAREAPSKSAEKAEKAELMSGLNDFVAQLRAMKGGK